MDNGDLENWNKLKLLKVTAHFLKKILKREVLKRVNLLFLHFFSFSRCIQV